MPHSSQPSTRSPFTLRSLALLAGVGIALAVGALPAHARTDPAEESGLIQLDSATAVARGGAPGRSRTDGPLTVPDRYGPGAILSVGRVRMKVINNGTLGN